MDSSAPRDRPICLYKREPQARVAVHIVGDESQGFGKITQGRQGSPNKTKLAELASLLRR
jgi:hypothetical protein